MAARDDAPCLAKRSCFTYDFEQRTLTGEPGPSIIEAAKQGSYDLLVLLASREERLSPSSADEP
ncbi:MAG: hypothetical protein MUF25_11520 [Pirellulaceae bacterium]|nr:hypothetical protein [Pirellulaceae bacterium]